LKPENLLLASKEEDITIKIADFGFAVKSKGPSSLTTQCGTPGYVAPEILLSKPYGKAVDMWSIGVIIFILLGGYPPFSDNNQSKLYKKIKAGQFEFHPDYWGSISKEAKDLIVKLLTVDPEKRFSADQALSHPWIDLHDDHLASDLNNNLAELKKYQAQRRFKAAGRAVLAVNKMKTLMTAKKESENETDTDLTRI
jgi:serine/threonine protein kinase